MRYSILILLIATACMQQGPAGQNGTNGINGRNGTPGIQGPQGNPGTQGPQGAPGVVPIPSPTPSSAPAPEAVYLGCFTDTSTRALPNELIDSGATVESCVAAAETAGYAFAGVQYGGQCFAGNEVGFAPATNCNMPCSADSSETCGGTWANSVYFVSK